MKSWIFLSLFFVSFNLFAQNQSKEQNLLDISLPTIIIKGSSVFAKDSLEFVDDLSDLWNTKELYKFEPQIDPYIFTQIKDSISTTTSKMVSLGLGYKYHFNTKAFFVSKEQPLFNFSLNSENFFYDKRLQSSITSLYWMPKIKNKPLNFNFEYDKFEVIKNISSTIFSIGYFQKVSLDNSYFTQMEILTEINRYKRETKKKNDINLIFSPVVEFDYFTLDFELVYFKQYPNVELQLFKDFDDIFFNRGSLFLFNTQENFIGSIGFLASINPLENYFVSIKNEPILHKESRKTLLKKNSLQTLDIAKRQTVSLLNFTTSISYKQSISLYNKLIYDMDKVVYKRDNILAKIYTEKFENVFTNQVGILGNIELEKLLLSTDIFFSSSRSTDGGERIPFLPLFNLSGKIKYKHNQINSTTLILESLLDREDEFGSSLDNLFITNINHKYQLKKNMDLFVELKNIFNSSSNRYPLYPNIGFELFAGFSILF